MTSNNGWARIIAVLLTVAALAAACGGGDDEGGPDPTTRSRGDTTGWHWQLQGPINTGYDVAVYDIDLFDTDEAVIEELRGADRTVICYFSAGSYEDWRADANDFPDREVGKALDGWEGERWVDIRGGGVRAVMADRLDLAVAKGCDGVEPDNVTTYNNDSGFDLTADDQLDYNRFLADEAHQRSLLIGLKNDLDQIPALVDSFDFAVNEECFQYDECELYRPFLDAGKPVLNAEYAKGFVDDPTELCRRAGAMGIDTLVLDLELDDSLRIACDP